MKAKKLAVALTASLVVTSVSPAYAMVGSEGLNRSLPAQEAQIMLVEPELAAISGMVDGDYSIDSIAAIQEYIQKSIPSDIYASLHIDSDNNAEGIVLSFTKELSKEQQNEILSLVDEPQKVEFRVVEFSEQELMKKQQEIDSKQRVLEAEGIILRTTGINVYSNKIEIGIEPFDDKNIAKVYELFGDDMIEVVQGHEIQLLATNAADTGMEMAVTTAADADDILMTKTNEEAKIGFFQRIVEFFKGLFSWGK